MSNIISNGITDTSFIDNGDELIIAKSQDITGILEMNKREYAAQDERKRWSEDAFGNKVASIPLTVFTFVLSSVLTLIHLKNASYVLALSND